MIRTGQLRVSHPAPNDRDVYPGRDEMNRRGVAENVRRDPFSRQRRSVLRCGLNILPQAETKAGGGQRLGVSVDEQRFIGPPRRSS